MSGPAAGPDADTRRHPLTFLLPAGALLLVAAMAITVAGVAVAPLFRPGTWLILVALLTTAAGGIVGVAIPANDA